MKKRHHIHLIPGDVGETGFLPGDVHRAKIIADHFDDSEHVTSNRQAHTYTGAYKGVKVSAVSTGIGRPAVAIAVEELIRVGAKNFIRIGAGDMIQTWLPVPSIIVDTAAVCGDGAILEFLPLEFPSAADFHTREALVNSAKELGVEVHPGIIRGHDAFYAEPIFTNIDYLERDRPWIEAGVLIVSNESSALFPLAIAGGCRAGAILSSAGGHQRPDLVADPEDFKQKITNAIRIALQSAVKLHQLDHPKE